MGPPPYKEGDRVYYRPLEGTNTKSIGVIHRVVTEPEGRGKVFESASEEHPCYYIHNERTGKTTLHRQAAVESLVE